MKLDNKSVVVTGAAGGMGEAIARLFVKEGARVVLADYNEEGVQRVADDLNNERAGSAVALKVDVSKQEDTDRMIETAVEEFGTLDVLVNNAGVMDGFEPVGEISDERWQKVMDVNVFGVMRTMRKAIAVFQEQGHGNIINVASAGGLFGARAGAAYTSSKHAVVGLTKNTGFLYAKENIRCNAIAPGAVATNISQSIGEMNSFTMERIQPGMGLNPRTGEASEIASAALFLASEDSSFVNATVLTVDGGWTAY